MAQRQADIHAQCGRIGVDDVRKHLDDGTYFNNEKEAGWAREWLDDKMRVERQEDREIQALDIAKRSERMSWVAIVISIVGSFIALFSLLGGQS